MRSPFPGMDPYLEHPELWPDVHHGLIEALRDSLAPQLRPRYRVAVEKRVYLIEPEGLVFVGRPDVAIGEFPVTRPAPTGGRTTVGSPVTVTIPVPDLQREAYLEVRDVGSAEVITTLEVLSPSNKRSGEGRRAYEIKRQRVLASLTHLVEIDLLRGGEPMRVLEGSGETMYRILVSESQERPRARLYAFGIREPIPSFRLPLRPGEEGPVVDMQELLSSLYERAGYDLAVRYAGDAEPPLRDSDAAWADELLRERGLRSTESPGE